MRPGALSVSHASALQRTSNAPLLIKGSYTAPPRSTPDLPHAELINIIRRLSARNRPEPIVCRFESVAADFFTVQRKTTRQREEIGFDSASMPLDTRKIYQNANWLTAPKHDAHLDQIPLNIIARELRVSAVARDPPGFCCRPILLKRS